jgi:hypothetical protein
MHRIEAILAVALVFAASCSAACAGDFVPRAPGGVAAVADDPGSRSPSDMGSAAAMDESDSAARNPTPTSHSTAAQRAAQIGTDDVASSDSHASTPAATADGDDKGGSTAAPPHKSHSLRWQSMLPGVMK